MQTDLETSRPPRPDLPRPALPRPVLPRPICPRCQRPQRGCLCHWITATDNRVALLILQHPLEQPQAKGSARLLGLSLRQCQVEVGDVFDAAALAAWLQAPAAGAQRPLRPLLLYPDAADGREPSAGPALPSTPLADPGGWRLVLIDGTWRQSRQLLRANPALQQLPRWPLPAPAASRYAIRKAQRPEQRSTLEAACAALTLLECRPERYTPLLAAFDGWVAEQASRSAGATPT